MLMIAPEAERRDALCAAFAQINATRYGTDLWRFASMADLNRRSVRHGRVFYRCTDPLPESLVGDSSRAS